MTRVRFGIGEDSHRFCEDKRLVLGGVFIPDAPGLHANSDGDAVLHALCNALSTAVGKGSLGTYADEMCQKGIVESSQYVLVAYGFVRECGYAVSNISISIEAGRPKMEKYFPAMKRRIANLLEMPSDAIGLSVTSGEKITPFGKGEGIHVFASVCLHSL